MSERIAILDTNVFGLSANLASPLWVSLRRLATERGITLAVPDIVLRESVNLRRSNYEEAARDFLDANTKMSRFYDLPPIYVPSEDEVAAAWEDQLRLHFSILDAEASDALSALEREAGRIPPARNGAGARDSLIWLTCKRLAAAGKTVIFVSRNTKDFADRDGKTLNKYLMAELSTIDGTVEYMNGLDGLFDILAVRSEGPNLDDGEHLRTLLLSAFLEEGVARIDFEEVVDHQPSVSEIEFLKMRQLRSYMVADKGLALISCDVEVHTEGRGDQLTLNALVWLQFDQESRAPTDIEIAHITRA